MLNSKVEKWFILKFEKFLMKELFVDFEKH